MAAFNHVSRHNFTAALGSEYNIKLLSTMIKYLRTIVYVLN